MAWDDVFGHALAKRIFQSHLASGEVAGAYLLIGPEGIGKRRLAIEMAKALNCVSSQARPCDRCPFCMQLARGVHPDLHLLIPGGASDQIKIDEVRQLLGRVALRPFSARTQVAIIDGAQRLTEEAANSLLKTLEEPSASTRFFLTTARLSDCLPTIVSRCQLIRCQPLAAEFVRRILIETQDCDPKVAEAVSRLAGGSVSAATDLAQRWNVYQVLLMRLASGRTADWFGPSAPESRQELVDILDGMLVWLRDLAVAATANPDWVTHSTQRQALQRQAGTIDVDRCIATALELVRLRDSMEQFVSPRLVMALAREKWLNLTR